MAKDEGKDADAAATPPAEPAQQETPKMADLEGIKFLRNGHDEFSLSVTDLLNMGAEDPKGPLVWNHSNHFTVAAGEINASTRDALLKSRRFTAV